MTPKWKLYLATETLTNQSSSHHSPKLKGNWTVSLVTTKTELRALKNLKNDHELWLQNGNRLLDLKRQNKIDETVYQTLRSTDGSPPAIRGSIKRHKSGFPLRPIVSSIGSALYNTSKFLSDILSPIQNLNGYSVLNSSQFAKEVPNMEIFDDEVMVSFDVVSLFTSIPVNKACDYIRNKLNNDSTLQSRTSLTTDDIISLLDFTLSNNYFVCNNCIYKQVHGCAMGSPVSPIVANLCMEVVEELAINTSTVAPRV